MAKYRDQRQGMSLLAIIAFRLAERIIKRVHGIPQSHDLGIDRERMQVWDATKCQPGMDEVVAEAGALMAYARAPEEQIGAMKKSEPLSFSQLVWPLPPRSAQERKKGS